MKNKERLKLFKETKLLKETKEITACNANLRLDPFAIQDIIRTTREI